MQLQSQSKLKSVFEKCIYMQTFFTQTHTNTHAQSCSPETRRRSCSKCAAVPCKHIHPHKHKHLLVSFLVKPTQEELQQVRSRSCALLEEKERQVDQLKRALRCVFVLWRLKLIGDQCI